MEYLYGIITQLLRPHVILASSFNLIIGYGGLIIAYFWSSSRSVPTCRVIGAAGVALAMLAGMLRSPWWRRSRSRRRHGCRVNYLMIASIGFLVGTPRGDQEFPLYRRPGGLTNIPPFLDPRLRPRELRPAGSGGDARRGPPWSGGSLQRLRARDERDGVRTNFAIGRDAMWTSIVIFGLGSGIAGFAGALDALFSRSRRGVQLCNSVTPLPWLFGARRGPVGAAAAGLAAGPHLSQPARRARSVRGPLFTGLVMLFMFFRLGLVPANNIWPSAAAALRVRG